MGCKLTAEEVAYIDRTIADLKSENDGYAGQLTRLTYEAELLRRENAKLRELVDYMTPIAWYAASERERDRMRELGVEVE